MKQTKKGFKNGIFYEADTDPDPDLKKKLILDLFKKWTQRQNSLYWLKSQ